MIMGLSHSIEDAISSKLGNLQHDLLRMNKVNYEDVVNLLEVLNSIMEDVGDRENTVIKFEILNPQVKDLLIWKLALRISCSKVVKSTGEVKSKRILKLYHFLRLYDDVAYQISSLDFSQISTELFRSDSSNFSLQRSNQNASSNECPICWVSVPDVVLPCAHAYCGSCIKQWNRECPLCRVESDIDVDSWQFVDLDDATDDGSVNTGRLLVGLTEKAGRPVP